MLNGRGYLPDGRAVNKCYLHVVVPITNIIRTMVVQIAAVISTTKTIYNLVHV